MKGKRKQEAGGGHCDQKSRDAAGNGEQHALREGLRDDLTPCGADGKPHCDCPRRATARASSKFATLAHAIRSTRPQTESRICKLRAYPSFIVATPAPAGTTVMDCFGRVRITSGIQLDG